MPRKKMKKTAQTKKAIVKQAKPNRQSSIEIIEKNFRAMPASIAAQYAKDISAVKQQEIKMKNELKKVQAREKIAKNKFAALMAKTQAKPTAANKKQLNVAKKAQDSLNKSIKSLSMQLDQIANHCKTLASKQAKFNMISKEIAKLEKQWEMTAKQAAKAAKTIKAIKKSSKKATVVEMPAAADMLIHEEQIQHAIPVNEPAEADA